MNHPMFESGLTHQYLESSLARSSPAILSPPLTKDVTGWGTHAWIALAEDRHPCMDFLVQRMATDAGEVVRVPLFESLQ